MNYEANFSFSILLHKRAKPIHPPYLLPPPTYSPIPHTPATHPSLWTPTHPPIPHIPPILPHTQEERFEQKKFIQSNYKTNSKTKL